MSLGTAVNGLHAAFMLAKGRSDGIARLSSDPGDAARSFIAIVLAVPPIIALRLLTWSGDTGIPADAARILAHDVMVYLVSWLAFAIVSSRVADKLGRTPLWPRFIVTYNWCNVVANTSIRLSTPSPPTPWAPRMRPVCGSNSSLRDICSAPG